MKVFFLLNKKEEKLNEREIYWIEEKRSLYPNGYNLLEGGKQAKHTDITKQKIFDFGLSI